MRTRLHTGLRSANVLSPANRLGSIAVLATLVLRILTILGSWLLRSMACGGLFIGRTNMLLALGAAGVYAVNK